MTAARRAKARRTAPAPGNGLTSAETQAGLHARARSDRYAETAQDYVEVVADLIDATGEARAVDIARRLGVTHVTVIKTVGRLQREGLLKTQPYRSIFLTDNGRKLAVETRRRHLIVVDFLRALGISTETALADAEGIEHHVSAETLDALEAFVKSQTSKRKAARKA